MISVVSYNDISIGNDHNNVTATFQQCTSKTNDIATTKQFTNGLDLLLEALSQKQCLTESSIENVISDEINRKRNFSEINENKENFESRFSDSDSIDDTSNDSSTNGTVKKARKIGFVTRRQKKNKDRVLIVFERPTLCFSKDSNDDIKHSVNCLNAFLPAQTHTQLKSISVLASLKGIDALDNGRYRVQLNTFLKDKKKFSRNSSHLYETLWIYEISLLIADSPTHLNQQLKSGNYQVLESFGCFGLFNTPIEYYFELFRHVLKFYEEGTYFSSELIQAALDNFDNLNPTNEFCTQLPSSSLFSIHSVQIQLLSEVVEYKFEGESTAISASTGVLDVGEAQLDHPKLHSDDEQACCKPKRKYSTKKKAKGLHPNTCESKHSVSDSFPLLQQAFERGLSLKGQNLSARHFSFSSFPCRSLPDMSIIKTHKPSSIA